MQEFKIFVRNKQWSERRNDMRRYHVWWVIFVAVIFVGGSASQTFSQTLVDKDIEQRLTNQTNRVAEGVKSKQLTQEEAKILQDNLSSIRQEGVRLQGDGKITAEEKTQLNKLLDQNNKMIQDKKKYPITAIAVPTTATTAAATPATPTAATPAPAKTAVPTPAAQDPEIKEKIASQQKRIDEGIKSQQFTLNESKTLQSNLDQIREEDTSARADGALSKEDKADLLQMLADNDKMIKDKKNNPVKDLEEHRALSERKMTIPERFAKQQRRIDNATKSKKLTSDESKILLDNLNFIKGEEARLRTANKLTAQEKERLHTLLDQNSAMIQKKKDNPVKTVK
jgi:hypothetical protein